MEPVITRHRHDTRRRALTVSKVTRLTPNMIRVTLEDESLADFISLGADDHIKLFFSTGGDAPEMRDYTPRAYDNQAQTLVLDFAVHGEGPATQWAVAAKPGDQLQIGGPRGSAVVAPIFDWYLLIGDETALPAMGRWVEELPEGKQVVTLASIASAQDEQHFDAKAHHTAHWVHRPLADAADPAPLLKELQGLEFPQGKGFIWIAAEAGVARVLRDHVQSDRNHPKEWLKASGYWLQGQADAHEKLD